MFALGNLLMYNVAAAGTVASGTTWNAATSGPHVTITNNGLTATFASSSGDVAKAGVGHSGAGDWWADVTVTVSGNGQIGVANATEGNTGGAFLGDSANSIGWNWTDGTFVGGTGGSGTSPAFATGDVIRIRLKNNKLYFAKNGTYASGMDPVAETGGLDVSAKGTLYPAVSAPGAWMAVADFTNWA